MVKSIHIGHGCMLFIGEQVEVWFKISLLHLVPGMPSSLCSVRCYLTTMRSQGSTPKVDQSCRKSHPKLCGWISEDIRTHTPPLLTYRVLPPARKWPLIAHNPVLLSCTRISLRTCIVFLLPERVLMCCAWHHRVYVPALLAQGSHSPSWIPADIGVDVQCNQLLWGMICYHSFRVQCLVPCRVEPLVQVTTFTTEHFVLPDNSFLEGNTSKDLYLGPIPYYHLFSIPKQTCVLSTTLLSSYPVLDFSFCLLATNH